MLQKIGMPGFEAVSHPVPEAIKALEQIMRSNRHPIVAEIGVGIGATTRELLRTMNGSGELHLFDYASTVNSLVTAIDQAELAKGVKIIAHGNTPHTFNSYAWKLAMTLKEAGKACFDLAFLDGAHTFVHDAPATCMLKELVKPGGYIVFDDVYWTFARSPTMNPTKRSDIAEKYSEEQINTPHIKLIIQTLVLTDPRFISVDLIGGASTRAVFRRTTS
ncbi:class I SAM-dependent methyltransferase [Leptospira interrogans]